MRRTNIARRLQGRTVYDEVDIRDTASAGNVDIERLRNLAQKVLWIDDFNYSTIGDAGTTAGLPWTKQDTSTAGAPTWDLVADTHGGEFTMHLAADNEAESLTLYLGDQKPILVTKNPILEARVKVDTVAANQRVVIGFAGDRNATLDDITENAWFRIEGNMNISVETDDGTTDNDDNDTGEDATADTYMILQVDLSDLDDIKFRVNSEDVTPETMNLSELTTETLQPFIEIQKDSGTGTPQVTIDWIKITADR